ncbi:FAD-binding protein [Schauerella aestuarii]|uniref:FAD-binding protein n=1 Tax=Schauerella aestuarii TaxID=2511204 RepID=UPI0013707198|nr:FAD-binding protein [Achromobacter aestuarii]MYZ42880.1 FAD-binding protein [Achromobacter aestuarii]
MQPSRRAFLSGRKPAPSAWEAFCRRLRGACDGVFSESDAVAGVGRARFAPAGNGDMAVVVSLGREYGVVIVLSGDEGAMTAPPDDRPAVYVDPVRLDGLTPVFAAAADARDVPASQAVPVAWDVQPGCPLGALADAGLTQFEGAPRARTLAHWLAAPHPGLTPGCTGETGIVAVEVLLADGTFEALGPFGADATQPLQSATVQALVPALFQAASSAEGQACRALGRWPLAYRLDALQPQAPHGVNLGQMLLGHGGTLAWVCRVRLVATPAPRSTLASADRATIASDDAANATAASVSGSGESSVGQDAAAADASRRLTRCIKAAFDAGDLFPMPG